MTQAYTSKNIEVLEGLRPFHAAGHVHWHHRCAACITCWEIVDNAIDEAADGHAAEIAVTLHKDGSCSVWDDGRGVPVDKHPTLGISGVELIYTKLHAGGKFGHQSYGYPAVCMVWRQRGQCCPPG